jgi:hypothetical protein
MPIYKTDIYNPLNNLQMDDLRRKINATDSKDIYSELLCFLDILR